MIIEIWIHGCQEDAWDIAGKAGLTGEARDKASRLAYEHKMTYEVDPTTGKGRLIRVDDRPLGE